MEYPNNRIILHPKNGNSIDLTEEYGLILTDEYTIEPPTLKENTIDIPGRPGLLDLSTSLTGTPVYGNRNMTFKFIVVNPENYESLRSELLTLLHGRFYRYALTMDPGRYYEGTFKIDSHKTKMMNEGRIGEFDISISAYPFCIVPAVYTIDKKGWMSIDLDAGAWPVRPRFINEIEGTRLVANGEYKTLSVGETVFPDLYLPAGISTILVNVGNYQTLTWAMAKAQLSYAQIQGWSLIDIYKYGTTPIDSDETLRIEFDRRIL